jgi:ABC-type nitrate/sulfonate/bicarbonate transport system permease component
MKRIVLLGAACLVLGACGSGSDSPAPVITPPVTASTTGIWKGTNTSTVMAPSLATLDLTQTGTSVAGSYSTALGVTGNVTGTINNAAMTMTITSTTVGCPGTLAVTATVTTPATGQPSIGYTYSGSTTCGGAETGSGTLIKQ